MSNFKKVLSSILHVLSVVFIFTFLIGLCFNSDSLKGIIIIGIIIIGSLILSILCFVGAEKLERSIK